MTTDDKQKAKSVCFYNNNYLQHPDETYSIHYHQSIIIYDMSQVYNTEPPTTGRVILKSSHGPIDIHLFCKEAPSTCRNFLQLCMDGYYDNVIFHRILDQFLIQNGLRRDCEEDESISRKGKGTDSMAEYHRQKLNGGDASSSAGSELNLNKLKLEVQPRIKFNHRGQVAMALPLEEDHENKESASQSLSLSRQFFITMDEAPFLNTKYVIFGTVRGDTIFNALRIGKTETIGETGELVDKNLDHAPKILDVRIVDHIFEDLVKTNEVLVPWKKKETGKEKDSTSKGDALKRKRKKRKGKKDLNVLSFGNEMEDMEDDFVVSSAGSGIQSSHDSKNGNAAASATEKKTPKQKSVRKEVHEKRKEPEHESKESDHDTIQKQIGKNGEAHSSASENNPRGIMAYVKRGEDDNTKRKRDRLDQVEPIRSQLQPQSNNRKPKLSALEARRLKYLKPKKGASTQVSANGGRKAHKQRDEETMIKLDQFKAKMFQIKGKGKNKAENIANGGGIQDDSLASRMARKHDAVKSQKEEKILREEAVPVYSGQILDDGGVVGEEGEVSAVGDKSTQWLEREFKCRRHIDHDSKAQAMGAGSSGVGGDGRSAEDYEVIDYKRKKGRKRY